MSDAVTALDGASFDGLVRVEDTGLQGMITLRGDLAASAVKKAATAVSGGKMPDPLTLAEGKTGSVAWMSPDELLVLCDYAEAELAVGKMTAALGQTHSLAVNVSDARAMFRVSGSAAREVMAKLCPLDFSPAAFQPGMFRRTRMAQIPAAVWMETDQSFCVICFRSVAQYAFDVLKTAARPGTAVGAF